MVKYTIAAIAGAIALYYAINTGPDNDHGVGTTAEPTMMIPKAHSLNPFKKHRLTT